MRSKKNKKKKFCPTILYVEGQDQFRGWFNSSLITSTILTGQVPYQQVISHGFVVDEKGHKMSKSLGNVIDPEEIMKKYGADILRLWVASTDFTKEVKVSISILENLQENYQKIRNTLRFLLSNLTNLPAEIQKEGDWEKNLNIVDYYILFKLDELLKKSQKNYREYNFNSVYSSLLDFCVNDLSAFYFEINKDSLYCDELNAPRRKQIITAVYYLLGGLLKIILPLLPYLSEEIYQNIPFRFGFAQQSSVHLINYTPFSLFSEAKIELITDFFLPLRRTAYQVLEKSRQEKVIAANSQAHLTIYLSEENKWDYSALNLTELLLVSEVEVKKKTKNEINLDFCFIEVKKTKNQRCLRCWNYRILKKDFCLRCEKIIKNSTSLYK